MTSTTRRLTAIATGQLGIVTRQQAHAAGISNRQLRSRVSSGTLAQVGTNTFVLPGAATGVPSTLRALVADVGGAVWVSGPTAAALHGFDGYRLQAPFDLVIERGRDVQRVGHRIHTSSSLDLVDRTNVDGIPTLSGARTLIDLARTETPDRLVVALDSGLRDGKFSEVSLHRRIVALRSRGRFGIPKLLDAIETHEFGRGGHSWLERRFLELVARAGLPRPDPQQVLTRARDRTVRVDFRFPDTDVVVEVLGYRYHRTPDQLERDAERMNALVGGGFRVFQYTYDMVVSEPDRVITSVAAALGLVGQRAS